MCISNARGVLAEICAIEHLVPCDLERIRCSFPISLLVMAYYDGFWNSFCDSISDRQHLHAMRKTRLAECKDFD